LPYQHLRVNVVVLHFEYPVTQISDVGNFFFVRNRLKIG